MPRDVLLVIGDQIIEAPMGWRSRSRAAAYRELCKEYFRGGARWVAAPPPASRRELHARVRAPEEGEPQRFIPTEYEPTFDAADAIKCGRDLFIGRSSCCNRSASNGCSGIWRRVSVTRSRSTTRTRCTSTRPSSRWRPASC